jgi:hypothetical protein
MVVRVLWVAVLALFGVGSCTSTVHYAVIVPQEAVEAGSGCYHECRIAHAGNTKQYLACLKGCPDARVVHEKKCNEVNFDRDEFACSTEHNQRFNPLPGFLLIALVALTVLLAGASAG